MINLSSEPSLGSMVLTRDGVLKYSYVLPRGMSFPEDAEGSISFTDRSGGEYNTSPFSGELSEDFTKITWIIQPQYLEQIPAGANFEVFITYDDNTYKVRYGRVVRKEAPFPLSPLQVDGDPLLYSDDMQRNAPGPRWMFKYGRTAMHPITGVSGIGYAMASRNFVDIFGTGINLWQSSAALWYAPTASDNIEMSVGLIGGGNGVTTIVLASNSSMTSFIGVRFTNGSTAQVVTGSAWNSTGVVGSSASASVSGSGTVYKIIRTLNPDKSSVVRLLSAAGSTLLTTTVSNAIPSGAGYRYVGATFQGDAVSTGPKLYSWTVKDTV